MSELKTNQIATNDGNNVAIDNSLNLKSYTTTQRDALTSVAGDMIYNSTTNKVQVYNGSSWSDLGTTAFTTEFVVIAGGGGGGGASGTKKPAGGAGAGGYISSVTGENSGGGDSAVDKLIAVKGTQVTISIGAGGAGGANNNSMGSKGTKTIFGSITAAGGGAGLAAIFSAPIGGFIYAIEELLNSARPVILLLVVITTFWADTFVFFSTISTGYISWYMVSKNPFSKTFLKYPISKMKIPDCLSNLCTFLKAS